LIPNQLLRFLSVLTLLFLCQEVRATTPPQPVAGTPLLLHKVRDRLGRTVTYYSSQAKQPAPILLLIQGSGCTTILHSQNGSTFSTLFGLFPLAAAGEFNVVAVEKPFADPAAAGGTAENCGKSFNEDFMAESWLIALQAALTDARHGSTVDRSRTVVLGVSEGAVMASLLAGRDPRVTDAIVISGSGTTQLFDFIARRYDQCFDRTACLADVESQTKAINADPHSATRFAWGHPFKRWSSFFMVDPGGELVRSRARVYVVLGTSDDIVPPLSQEITVARLLAAGRSVTVSRVAEGNHSLMRPGDSDFSGLDGEIRRALQWARDKPSSPGTR